MSISNSNYKALVSFAYISKTALSHPSLTLRGDELLNYLLFSFEKNQEEGLIIEQEEKAYFNTGLKNSNNEPIYAYFVLNINKRQKWFLRQLATPVALSIEDTELKSVCAIEDYNRVFYDFAFAHDDKFKGIMPLFEDDLHAARTYIMDTYMRANRLGYIHYENQQAVFNTGLKNASDASLYAVFSKNTSGMPEWYLNGFMPKPNGFTHLPDFVQISNLDGERNMRKTDKKNYDVPENCTLLVTAISLEYDELLSVLKDTKLHYTEKKTSSVGGREFSYIYIEEINTVALLTGQSFECMIPIIQGILYFKPRQAILSGIAFSFDMKAAPYNSIVVSNNVWDYESAKINGEITTNRGNKLPASVTLRQLYTSNLDRGMVIKSGNYASGMKVVNSLEYQEKIKEVEPELLAGDQEGFFFAHACNEFKINWIIIKAISDYGVGKTDAIQKVAAFAALKYVIKGLQEADK